MAMLPRDTRPDANFEKMSPEAMAPVAEAIGQAINNRFEVATTTGDALASNPEITSVLVSVEKSMLLQTEFLSQIHDTLKSQLKFDVEQDEDARRSKRFSSISGEDGAVLGAGALSGSGSGGGDGRSIGQQVKDAAKEGFSFAKAAAAVIGGIALTGKVAEGIGQDLSSAITDKLENMDIIDPDTGAMIDRTVGDATQSGTVLASSNLLSKILTLGKVGLKSNVATFGMGFGGSLAYDAARGLDVDGDGKILGIDRALVEGGATVAGAYGGYKTTKAVVDKTMGVFKKTPTPGSMPGGNTVGPDGRAAGGPRTIEGVKNRLSPDKLQKYAKWFRVAGPMAALVPSLVDVAYLTLTDASDEEIKKATIKALKKAGGGIVGTFVGGAIGTSIFPGWGTLIAGGLLGTAGSIWGDDLIDMVADFMMTGEQPSEEKIAKVREKVEKSKNTTQSTSMKATVSNAVASGVLNMKSGDLRGSLYAYRTAQDEYDTYQELPKGEQKKAELDRLRLNASRAEKQLYYSRNEMTNLYSDETDIGVADIVGRKRFLASVGIKCPENATVEEIDALIDGWADKQTSKQMEAHDYLQKNNLKRIEEYKVKIAKLEAMSNRTQADEKELADYRQMLASRLEQAEFDAAVSKAGGMDAYYRSLEKVDAETGTRYDPAGMEYMQKQGLSRGQGFLQRTDGNLYFMDYHEIKERMNNETLMDPEYAAKVMARIESTIDGGSADLPHRFLYGDFRVKGESVPGLEGVMKRIREDQKVLNDPNSTEKEKHLAKWMVHPSFMSKDGKTLLVDKILAERKRFFEDMATQNAQVYLKRAKNILDMAKRGEGNVDKMSARIKGIRDPLFAGTDSNGVLGYRRVSNTFNSNWHEDFDKARSESSYSDASIVGMGGNPFHDQFMPEYDAILAEFMSITTAEKGQMTEFERIREGKGLPKIIADPRRSRDSMVEAVLKNGERVFVDKDTLPNYKSQIGFLDYRKLMKKAEKAYDNRFLQKTFKDDRVKKLTGASGSVDEFGNILETAMTVGAYDRLVAAFDAADREKRANQEIDRMDSFLPEALDFMLSDKSNKAATALKKMQDDIRSRYGKEQAVLNQSLSKGGDSNVINRGGDSHNVTIIKGGNNSLSNDAHLPINQSN